jgi:hypothetical protein
VAQAPGSLFVAFYDSQGYGGGILTRLHIQHIILYNTWVDPLALHGTFMAIMLDVVRGSPQSFQINVRILPRLGHGRFFPNHYLPFVLPIDAI